GSLPSRGQGKLDGRSPENKYRAGVRSRLRKFPLPAASQSPDESGGSLLAWSSLVLGFADGALLAKLGAAADFARFFVVFALAEFLLQTAALQKFLEPP